MGDRAPIRYRHLRRLDGLGITLARVPGANRCAAVLSVRGGFRFDPPGREGLSHLVEHLAFAGPRRERGERLARLGGYVNGMTGVERVQFCASGPSANGAEVVEFLGAMLGPGPVSPAQLEHELRVIGQEVAQRAYSGWEAQYDTLMGRIVLGPGRWIGTLMNHQGVCATPLEEVNRGMALLLAPRNAWLSVASSDPEAHAGALLDSAVEIPETPWPERPREGEPPAIERVMLRPVRRLDRVGIYRAFHSRPVRVYPGAALHIVCDILDGGPHAELFQAFRARSGLAYSSGLNSHSFEDCSVLVMHTQVDAARGAEALGVLNEITSRLRSRGLREEQLAEAKARITHHVESALESVEAISGCMAGYVSMGRPSLTPEEVARDIREMDLETVNGVLERLLRPERMVTLVVGGMPWWRRRGLRRLARG